MFFAPFKAAQSPAAAAHFPGKLRLGAAAAKSFNGANAGPEPATLGANDADT